MIAHADMGQGRKTRRKNPGFIDSVLDLIDSFYGDIVQNITRWQAPAPKLKKVPSLEAAVQADAYGADSDLEDDEASTSNP